MKAYVIDQYGADARFKLAEIETPKPGEGEVLITVKATSVNPIDNKLLRHELGFNPELPAVLHGDVAGVVSALGPGVKEFELGDEVYGCVGGFIGTPGALAEYVPADARLIARKPASLTFTQTAALPLVVLTAWESLIDSARIEAGEQILIHGGAGGVGHVAIQLAKTRGARVAATVSSRDKAEIARSLGADDIVYYREEVVEDYVERLTDGRGFDVVYDTVSGPVFEQSLQATRTRGRIITVFTGTDSTTQDLMSAFVNAVTVHTQNMSIPLISGEGREHHGEILRQAAQLVDTGELEPLIDTTHFNFSQVNDAHALFESKQHLGKIVLDVGEWD